MERVAVDVEVKKSVSSHNFHHNMTKIMSHQVNRPVWGVRRRRLRGSVWTIPYHRLYHMNLIECIR
jgi:hypothetical protein